MNDEEICPFCGMDPYHYVDVGLAFPARVSVICCDEAIEAFAKARSEAGARDPIDDSDWHEDSDMGAR